MENDVHVQHYIDVIKRRKFHFILPTVLVFLVSITVAFVLPSTYEATATILIEAQEIPQDLVRTTVTGYVEERLQTISKRVLSDTNLLDIVERFALLSDLGDQNTTQTIIQEMRERITVETIKTQVQTDRFSRPVESTIAFTLSFEGNEPANLAQVANHLASLFLEENARDREEKANTTIQFLEKQLAILDSELENTEAQLASFKEQNINELPELMQLNLKTMDQLERQIDTLEQHIDDLINRKIYLEGQLALLTPIMYKVSADGKRVLTPKEELQVLRSQYMALSASHSEHHPDVIKLKKKLAALEGEVGTQQELRQLHKELYDKKHELTVLLEKVSPKHPDAIKLKKEVAALGDRVQRLSAKQKVFKVEDEKPENPAYINVQTRVASTQMEIDAAKREFKQLQKKYEDYRGRVENTPIVEQRYLELQRNYGNTKTNYQQTLNRLQAAKESLGLEEGRMGEKFTLIQPATTPEEPDKPNRLAIFLLGVVLAAGSGLGVGSMAEYMDRSVHTVDELAKIAGNKEVLAVIPYWETSHEVTRKRRRIWVLVGSSVAIAAVALVALNLLYTP
jgi:uncharacterized protein involved in exopolysaccharide biosynthesis